MSWAKIDDGFLDHPKAIEAGEDAANLYLRGLVYCSKHLTDGRIPKGALRVLTGHPAAAESVEALVRVGLWEDAGAAWQVHDYLDWNEPAEEVKAKRARKAEYLRERRSKKEEPGKITVSLVRTERVPGSYPATNPVRTVPPPTPTPTPEKTYPAAVVPTTEIPRRAQPNDGPGREAPNDPPLSDLWDLLRRMSEAAKGALDCTLFGASERTFAEARAALRRQGYDDADFVGLAEMAAAGELGKRYRGKLALAPMLGRPEGDGERAASGLLFALRLQRDWRTGRARAAPQKSAGVLVAERMYAEQQAARKAAGT